MSDDIFFYDTNPNDNGFTPADGGMPELMQRSDVNNAARVRMAALRKYYNDPEFLVVRIQGPEAADVGIFNRVSTTRFNIQLAGVDLTSFFADGRIIKIVDGGGAGVDLITQVAGTATFSDPFTIVDIKVSDSINVAATDVQVHAMASLKGLSLLDSQSTFFIPDGTTGVAVQAAIDAAQLAGGGIVLLTESLYTTSQTIDLTSAPSVDMWGTGTNTVLRQETGANLNQLIDMSSGSSSNEIRGILLDVNRAGNSGSNFGVLLFPAAQRLTDLIIQESAVGIKILPNALARKVSITGCTIFDFQQAGIESSAATDAAAGVIENCDFNALQVISPDPAAIKVAGNWLIANNVIRNVESGTRLVRGIWLWNHTVSGNGGNRCTVTGNRIEGGNGQRRGIENGGSDNTITGNVIDLPGILSVGIYTISLQAGNPTQRGTITGNDVTAEIGIQSSALTSALSIAANSILATLTGIDVNGDLDTIDANQVEGGITGIAVNATCSETDVSNNKLRNQVTRGLLTVGAAASPEFHNNRISGGPISGVEIDAATTGAKVTNTSFSAGITNDILDAATGTIKWSNGAIFRRDIDVIPLFTPVPVTNFTLSVIAARSIPEYGGAGEYEINSFCTASGSNTDVIQIRIHHGPLGNASDPYLDPDATGIYTYQCPIGGAVTFLRFINLTLGPSRLWSVSWRSPGPVVQSVIGVSAQWTKSSGV